MLRVFARDAGVAGDLIRVGVDYATSTPELTFNVTAYRSVLNADGTFGQTGAEAHLSVSMDQVHPRYVETIVNNASTLIRVEDVAPAQAAANTGGVSIGGLFLNTNPATALADIRSAIVATQRGAPRQQVLLIPCRFLG